jgi:hypothetical protein
MLHDVLVEERSTLLGIPAAKLAHERHELQG